MSRTTKVLFGLCVILFVVMLWIPPVEKVDPRVIILQKRERMLQHKIDSIQNEFDYLAQHYQVLKHRADSLSKAKGVIKKSYDKIIYRNYTDPQRDSILTKLYPIGAANR